MTKKSQHRLSSVETETENTPDRRAKSRTRSEVLLAPEQRVRTRRRSLAVLAMCCAGQAAVSPTACAELHPHTIFDCQSCCAPMLRCGLRGVDETFLPRTRERRRQAPLCTKSKKQGKIHGVTTLSNHPTRGEPDCMPPSELSIRRNQIRHNVDEQN
jgi:hypothetical protein